ncbi:MAG: DUF1611 domain-containing protein [Myxococcota bacterium]
MKRHATATPLERPATDLPARILRNPDAFRAYTTRRVPRAALTATCRDIATPAAGDLVLARVEALGHHKRLHLPNGRRRQLFAGDEIIVAYADRYAPQQFEARVPPDLGPCHLVASGGVAGRVETRHRRIRSGPTRIRPIGLVCSEPGEPPLNVANWALPPAPHPEPGRVPIIAALGTSMDSGKTTSVADLAHGATSAGYRVGYAKVTGTGAAGDPMLMVDAGADPVLDFTDVGHVSTYLLSDDVVESILLELIGHLQHARVDVILLEVADGLLQRETAALASGPLFRRFVDGCLFAAPDAMSAVAGVAWLRDRRLPGLGLCGSIETSPLQVREASEATALPHFGRSDLADPATAAKLISLAATRGS